MKIHGEADEKVMKIPRFAGQSGCELCPPGTFNSQAAGLSCRRCSETFEPGQRPRWASLGSSTCSACPAGALCEPDENGFYTPRGRAQRRFRWVFPSIFHGFPWIFDGFPLFHGVFRLGITATRTASTPS